MNDSRRTRRRLWALASLLLLAGLLCAARAWHGPEARHAPLPAEAEEWDIAQLARHLEGKGLKFRVVTPKQGFPEDRKSAYLTTTDRTWEQLEGLRKFVE